MRFKLFLFTTFEINCVLCFDSFKTVVLAILAHKIFNFFQATVHDHGSRQAQESGKCQRGQRCGTESEFTHLQKLHLLGDNLQKLELTKTRQKLNLPVQIGCSIWQYAMLKMLEWHYDFLNVFVDRSDFEYIERDTNSAYCTITAPYLEQLIKP